MITNWAYAALAEHIYRRNQGSDQAIRVQDLSGKGGLRADDVQVLRDLTPNEGALTARGFFISEGRYIYNPATGFQATIARGAAARAAGDKSATRFFAEPPRPLRI